MVNILYDAKRNVGNLSGAGLPAWAAGNWRLCRCRLLGSLPGGAVHGGVGVHQHSLEDAEIFNIAPSALRSHAT